MRHLESHLHSWGDMLHCTAVSAQPWPQAESLLYLLVCCIPSPQPVPVGGSPLAYTPITVTATRVPNNYGADGKGKRKKQQPPPKSSAAQGVPAMPVWVVNVRRHFGMIS